MSGWDHAQGLPGRRRHHRRRARRGRGGAPPDGRRGGARFERAPAAEAAAAGLLPADEHRPDRHAGRGRPQDDQGRRPAEPARRALHARRPGHLRLAARRPRADVRLRDRRRRRVRPRGGEVLPRPLRRGLEDPHPRPAARLRRPLAPQRVPRAQPGGRRRRRDDPPQRRHREPRQRRHVERDDRRAARHPRRVRPARARHARVLRRRLGELPQHEHARHPGLVRHAPDAAVPEQGLGQGLRRPEPHRAQHGRRLDGVHGPHALQRRRPRRDREDPDRPDDRLDLPQARPEDRPGEEGDPLAAHLPRVPHEVRGRARAGGHPVPAPRPRPARRRRAGRLSGRHVGARQPGLQRPRPDRRVLPRHRPHAAVRAEPQRRPEPHVAGRQRLAAAAARGQADPGHHRRRRRRASDPGEHRQGRRRLHEARPAREHGPDPAQQLRPPRQARETVPPSPPRARPREGRLPARREVAPRRGQARRDGVLEPRDRADRRGPAAQAGRGPLLRPQGAAHLRPRRAEQLAGVRRREDQQRQPARQQPVLGQPVARGRRPLRLRLRPDARTSRRRRPRRSASPSSPPTTRPRRSSRPTRAAASGCWR